MTCFRQMMNWWAAPRPSITKNNYFELLIMQSYFSRLKQISSNMELEISITSPLYVLRCRGFRAFASNLFIIGTWCSGQCVWAHSKWHDETYLGCSLLLHLHKIMAWPIIWFFFSGEKKKGLLYILLVPEWANDLMVEQQYHIVGTCVLWFLSWFQNCYSSNEHSSSLGLTGWVKQTDVAVSMLPFCLGHIFISTNSALLKYSMNISQSFTVQLSMKH